MKIEIEKEPYSFTKYFGGEVVIDVGDELERKEQIYEFTLEENYDADIDHTNFQIEFIDEVPENREEVEKEIIKQYQER